MKDINELELIDTFNEFCIKFEVNCSLTSPSQKVYLCGLGDNVLLEQPKEANRWLFEKYGRDMRPYKGQFKFSTDKISYSKDPKTN